MFRGGHVRHCWSCVLVFLVPSMTRTPCVIELRCDMCLEGGHWGRHCTSAVRTLQLIPTA